MGNYEQLKQSVSNVIKTNGNQEITGSILQNVLLTIISTVGANATFAGIATPATNPGTPDGPVFYLASEGGTYSNFGGVELQDGLSVLSWNGSWSSQQIFSIDDIPTVFDISAHNLTDGQPTKYTDLETALGANGANVPVGVRRGGMSVKYVQSSDNKYVQYRLTSDTFTTTASEWQKQGVEVTVSQNTQTGHTDINIGNESYPIPSLSEIYRLDLLSSFNPENVFTISGKMYSDGGWIIDNNVLSTPLIELVGVTQIEYNLFLSNTGQVVSFFDANGNYLPNISITPTEGVGVENYGIINITNSAYINAKYVAFSHYNAGNNYIKFSPSLAENQIQIEKLQARIGIDVNFDKKGMAYVDGVLVNSSSIYSTELISLYGIIKIKYNLYLNNTAQIISFFDENGEFLSDISVTAPTTYGQYNEGEIDLTQSAYTNAKYVGFSKYLTTSYVVEFSYNEETPIEKTNKNTKDIDFLFSEIGQKLVFDLNVIYSNGVPSANDSVKGTPLIDTSNFRYLMYRLYLNNTGQVVSFYDSDKNYLSEISITASETYIAQVATGIIDLTDTAYSNVKYVALCCWHYNDTFYGSLNNELDVLFRLTTLEKEKPFLVGKKFCALGDSITDGDGNNSYSWYDMLLDRYDAVEGSLNFAETGQCLRTMADRCTAENMANIDICFVMGGTNQLSNYRLGSINDEPTPDKWKPNTAYTVGDKVLGGTLEQHGWTTPIYAYLYWYECVTAGTSGNSSDASGFNHTIDSITDDGTVQWKCLGNPSWYSDMKGICRRVWGFNPKIQIIWIVPIKTKNDADVLNPELWARAEKFQAIRDFCNANSIRFIDLQKEFPLNTYTKNAIMADSLHPNDKGYRIIQDIVCSHIE